MEQSGQAPAGEGGALLFGASCAVRRRLAVEQAARWMARASPCSRASPLPQGSCQVSGVSRAAARTPGVWCAGIDQSALSQSTSRS